MVLKRKLPAELTSCNGIKSKIIDEKFVIKCKLKPRVKNENFFLLLKNVVRCISTMKYIASHAIGAFILQQCEEIDNSLTSPREFFKIDQTFFRDGLVFTNKNKEIKKNNVFIEYLKANFSHRRIDHVPNISQTVSCTAREMLKDYENNLKMNIFRRLRLLANSCGVINVTNYDVKNYLLDTKEGKKFENQKAIEIFLSYLIYCCHKFHLPLLNIKFTDEYIDNNLEFFTFLSYKILQRLREENMKLFILVPTCKLKLHHILIDRDGFVLLYNSLLQRGQKIMKNNEKQVCTAFQDILKLPRQKNNIRFSNAFQTNGYTISLIMNRKVLQKSNCSLHEEPGNIVVGIDPGKKNFVACVRDDHTNTRSKRDYLYIKSATLRHDRGDYKRAALLKKERKDIISIENNFKPLKTTDIFEKLEAVDERLQTLEERSNVYYRLRLQRRNFDKYIANQRILAKYAKQIINFKSRKKAGGVALRYTVYFGNTKSSFINKAKGHSSVPVNQLIRAFQQLPLVELIFVNEYNTTKECCFCKTLVKITQGYRNVYCEKCMENRNRDINAAINILQRGKLNN